MQAEAAKRAYDDAAASLGKEMAEALAAQWEAEKAAERAANAPEGPEKEELLKVT